MNHQEHTAQQVQNIFIIHFDIEPEQFSWEKPLEVLQKDFKILSYLVFLEQLIHQHFELNIPLIENISTAFHTPKDILNLINKEL